MRINYCTQVSRKVYKGAPWQQLLSGYCLLFLVAACYCLFAVACNWMRHFPGVQSLLPVSWSLMSLGQSLNLAISCHRSFMAPRVTWKYSISEGWKRASGVHVDVFFSSPFSCPSSWARLARDQEKEKRRRKKLPSFSRLCYKVDKTFVFCTRCNNKRTHRKKGRKNQWSLFFSKIDYHWRTRPSIIKSIRRTDLCTRVKPQEIFL